MSASLKPLARIVFAASLLMAMLVAGVRQAHAIGSHHGISFDTYSEGSISDPTRTVGWDFQTALPTTVTHLGYYDYAADGLTLSHDVAIYYGPGFGALTGTQVPGASGTVAAGTSEIAIATSTDVSGGAFATFRYHDILDVLLPATLPGQFYRIAAVDGDTTQESPVDLQPGPHISLGDAWQEISGGVLVYPDQAMTGGSTRPWSGPNFLFPEPSSMILLATGGALLLSRRHRSAA